MMLSTRVVAIVDSYIDYAELKCNICERWRGPEHFKIYEKHKIMYYESRCEDCTMLRNRMRVKGKQPSTAEVVKAHRDWHNGLTERTRAQSPPQYEF